MHKHSHHHFKGKEALEHVLEARLKGKIATEEIHGTELSGHVSAFADAAKETSLLFVLIWAILKSLQIRDIEIHWTLICAFCGWLVWKIGRSAILGWARLERMHRVIEEERWEIEHHREQEREELRELYAAKGFSGPLLDEVIDTLMADDNRLLNVMLQEELGFKLESQEHPIKQAMGAGAGVFFSSGIMSLVLFTLPPLAVPITAAILIGMAAAGVAHLERNQTSAATIWNIALGALAIGIIHFAIQILS